MTRRSLPSDIYEEQVQEDISEALHRAEYGRLIGDSDRSTAAMKEAKSLAMDLIRTKRGLTRRETLLGIPAPAVGSAPGAPDGKKPSGRYSFVALKGTH